MYSTFKNQLAWFVPLALAACATQDDQTVENSDPAQCEEGSKCDGVSIPISFDFEPNAERAEPAASKLSLQNAYWLAKLSAISYSVPEKLPSILSALRIPQIKLVTFSSKVTGMQGFYLDTGSVGFVIFRGTEVTSLTDLLTDADGLRKLPIGAGSSFGQSGFVRSIQSVWGKARTEIDPNTIDLRQLMIDHKGPLYFGGHSLGGGLAMIAAQFATFDGCRTPNVATPSAWDISEIPISFSKDETTDRYQTECLNHGISFDGIYTYGQPAAGNSRFSTQLDQRLQSEQIPYFRFINRNDPVPSLSPASLDYSHVGDIPQLNSRVAFLSPLGVLVEKAIEGRGSPDCLNAAHDHDVNRYVKKIRSLVLTGKFNATNCRAESNEEGGK